MKYLKAEPFENGIGKVAIAFVDRLPHKDQYVYTYVNKSGGEIGMNRSMDGVLCLGKDSSSVSEASLSEGLRPVPINTSSGIRWGYKDGNGKLDIEAAFISCSNFSNGLAIASVHLGATEHNLPPSVTVSSANGNFGFIDKRGKFVIPPKYKNVSRFSEGVAAVQVKERWGYINRSGQLQIQPNYEFATDFSEGLAAVKINGKWGYVNKNGRLQIQPNYEIAYAFHEGLAAVSPRVINDNPRQNKSLPRVGFIDKSGNMVIAPSFYMPFRGSYFSNGLAPVVVRVENPSFGDEYKFGFIDLNGSLVIKPQFYEASEFSDGLASACICMSTSLVDNHTQYASVDKRIWNQRSSDR